MEMIEETDCIEAREPLEKPKRVISQKQLDGLARGRETRKANKLANVVLPPPPPPSPVLVVEEQPEPIKKPRKLKVVKKPEPEPEPEIEEEPEPEPEPVKKPRKPREPKKKVVVEYEEPIQQRQQPNGKFRRV